MPGATTTHHYPQLFTIKVSSDNKVPLVKMSQDDPLNPSSKKNYQVDSDNNNLGESNMIKEKVINNPFRRVSQSGQVEIKLEYLYTITNTYNLVLNKA